MNEPKKGIRLRFNEPPDFAFVEDLQGNPDRLICGSVERGPGKWWSITIYEQEQNFEERKG